MLKQRFSFLLIFHLFMFNFTPSPLFAQEWSEPMNITNLGGYSRMPDMIIDKNGIIHVVWDYHVEDNFSKIMYSRSEDEGETWSEPLDLLQNTDLWMSRPHIGSDNKCHLYVAYTHNTMNVPEMLIKMVIFDGNEWSKPILVSEGMPGSSYDKVVVDNDDRVFVFWAYGSQFTYYRYLENGNWSHFYCPYCDSADIFAFADGNYLFGNLMCWVGSSVSYNYYGERAQYYEFNMSTNTWAYPEMINDDTINLYVDIALNNKNLPECAYHNYPSGDDNTKFTQKEGNYWSNSELVNGVNGTQKYQQIAVDQNDDVHIVEQQETVEGYGLVHYKKWNEKWVGQFIDSNYIVRFQKLLFNNNKLYLVYSKTWEVEKEFFADLFFTKYDIVTSINGETRQTTELKIYPNPGSDNIYIEFENDKQQQIDLSVYDITGKHIITLINKILPQGRQQILWNSADKNGKEVNSGSYVVRMKSGRNIVTTTVEIVSKF